METKGRRMGNDMSKAIMMSVHPQCSIEILNGEKTIDIRTSVPKCELPVDVYVYCTKSNGRLILNKENCACFTNRLKEGCTKLNGKVIAKFTLKKVEEIKPFSFMQLLHGLTEKQKEIADKACIGWLGIYEYANGKSTYAWHISDLQVFDRPKELSEFGLKKAQQSWCYVEVE